MAKLISALVGASMLGLVGVANAAEPVILSDAQLDDLTAGGTIYAFKYNGNVGVFASQLFVGIGKIGEVEFE